MQLALSQSIKSCLEATYNVYLSEYVVIIPQFPSQRGGFMQGRRLINHHKFGKSTESPDTKRKKVISA